MAEQGSRRWALRRLYDGLLSWSETPYGGLVLFLWAFVESSVFPIPPDAFLIAMVLGARSRAWRFALIASAASVLGGIAGYGVGHWLWWSGPGELSQVAQFFFDRVPASPWRGFSASRPSTRAGGSGWSSPPASRPCPTR